MRQQFIIPLVLFSVVILAEAQQSDRISELNRKLLSKQADVKAKQATSPQTLPKTNDSASKAPTLSQRTHFLSDGSLSVMIPRGALIHLPEKGRITVQNEIIGRLVEWNEFVMQNRNAIRLEEVDINQLQSQDPLDPEAMERIKEANLPTLTSYQGKIVALAAFRKSQEVP